MEKTASKGVGDAEQVGTGTACGGGGRGGGRARGGWEASDTVARTGVQSHVVPLFTAD